MDGGCPDAPLLELAGDAVGAMLGAGEHDGRSGSGHDLGGPVDTVARRDAPEEVDCRAGVVLVDLELVAGRVVLVSPHQHVDVAVERGGEEEGLTPVGGQVQDAADVGQEAHVGHAVGLVDHDDLDGVEADAATLQEVTEAAGAGHGDVHATREGLQLGAVAHATVEALDVEASRVGEHLEFGGDLSGQLAGGRQHEDSGMLRLGGLALQVGDGADPEGERLARSGGGLAADVATGQGVGQGHRLDGEG